MLFYVFIYFLFFISRFIIFFFFFQAEDGIRGRDVTGVQTCALPISPVRSPRPAPPAGRRPRWFRGRDEPRCARLPRIRWPMDCPARPAPARSRCSSPFGATVRSDGSAVGTARRSPCPPRREAWPPDP